MAADIFLYDAAAVPVGDDQRQHLELTRDVAIRFNHRYGDTFVVPEAAIPGTGARVMDLQHPERKMSKSADSPLGTIRLLDSEEEITKKVRKAVTDTDGEMRYDREAKPGLANLLDLLARDDRADAGGGGGRLRALRRPEERRGGGVVRPAPTGAGTPRRARGRPALRPRRAGRAVRRTPTRWRPPPTPGPPTPSASSRREPAKSRARPVHQLDSSSNSQVMGPWG